MSKKQQHHDGGSKDGVLQMIPLAIFQDDDANLFTVTNTVIIPDANCKQNVFPSHDYIGDVEYEFLWSLQQQRILNQSGLLL